MSNMIKAGPWYLRIFSFGDKISDCQTTIFPRSQFLEIIY